MIEIETKIRLLPEVSRKELLAKLIPKLDAPLKEERQIDTVFLLPEQVDEPIQPGSKIMRVRDILDVKSGRIRKSLLTLKVQKQAKLESDEYKFAVVNGKAARQLIMALGWRQVVVVDKLRAESRIHKYTVCIDEVKQLGMFIELELLTEEEVDVKIAQENMKKFLVNLGIKGEIWSIPYDTSIRNLEA